MKKLALLLTLVLSMGIAVAACGSDDSDSGSSPSVEVTDVWARATTPTQDTGAVYMTINSADGDTLTSAAVPTSIAGKTEIHETTTEGGEPTAAEDSMESGGMDSGSEDMDTTGGDSGMEGETSGMHGGSGAMMGMKQIDQLEIPAGETVTLEPGGFHIMLLELKGQINAGDTIPVTLTFEKAGEVQVDALARDE